MKEEKGTFGAKEVQAVEVGMEVFAWVGSVVRGDLGGAESVCASFEMHACPPWGSPVSPVSGASGGLLCSQ